MNVRISGMEAKGTCRSYKRIETVFYKTVFIFVLAYIFSLILNYNSTWMHPEVCIRDIPNALANGTPLVAKDLMRGFDYKHFDGVPRPRFVSYSFQIVNIKFRHWLFHYIPPHPSLSLSWLFSLILSPILLFMLISNITHTRTAAWIGVSLYCVSTGFLSGIVMLNHPGKPLTNFSVILCLYCASKISIGIKEKGLFPKGVFTLYIFLLCTLLIALFADETALFLLICIPSMFPAIFISTNNRTLVALLYLSTCAIFLLLVSFCYPYITKALGFGTFDFWNYLDHNHNLWQLFTIRNLMYNSSKLLFCNIVPSRELFVHETIDENFITNGSIYSTFSIIYIVAFFSCFTYLIVRLPPAGKKLFFRSFITVLLFMLFHTILSTGHKGLLHSSYYYGALASVFLAIMFSIVLSSFKHGFLHILSLSMFIVLLLTSAHNFIFINRSWIDIHDKRCYQPLVLKSWYKGEQKQLNEETGLTYSMVLRAWNNRKDKDALLKMRSEFPAKAYWLFCELDYY